MPLPRLTLPPFTECLFHWVSTAGTPSATPLLLSIKKWAEFHSFIHFGDTEEGFSDAPRTGTGRSLVIKELWPRPHDTFVLLTMSD